MTDTATEHPFLTACRRGKAPYTPVWLMRQAGRYMKHYRDIRARVGFLELCKTPDLVAEVTVTPVERLNVDAAIIFADILLLLEPMGVGLEYAEGGPVIQRPVRTGRDVDALRDPAPEESLSYVYDAVRATRAALAGRVPLIGFWWGYGTTARVIKVERLEEGRMNILTAGERRFETHDVTQRTPHMVGQVKYLEEEPGEPSEEAMAEFREEYGEYIKNLSSLAGGWTSQPVTPQDPVTLSYSAASSLDLPLHVRQTLLESPTAGRRLERLLPMVKHGNQAVQQAIAKRNPFQGPRLN